MNPVAFRIFGIDVMWYGILISLGVFLGIVIALKECKRIGFKEDDLIDYLLFAIPSGILGARIYYVIFSWNYYGKNLDQIFNIRNGGLAIHGALIAGVIVSIIFCKIKKINPLQILDILMPGVALGQAIGRWGNYINQEAYGGPTDLPWGILIDGVKVHPTFLYESIINVLVCIFLIWYSRNKKKVNGEVFAIYLILYSAGRFFVEGLRTDSLMFLGMRVAQLISVASILLGISIFVYLRKNKKADE